MTELTLDQYHLLAELTAGAQPALGTDAERGLVDAGLAERTGTGEIRLTARGRDRADGDGELLSTWLNSFRKD